MTIQEEVNEQYQNIIARIESDLAEGKTFSFHHYAIKFGLTNVQILQKEWAKHNHAKRANNDTLD